MWLWSFALGCSNATGSPNGDENEPAFVSNFTGDDWSDDGTWEAVGGQNHDTYLQIFTTAVDANVPSGRGMRTRGPQTGQNGDNFWNVIRIASGSRPRTPDVGESITWRWYYKLISGDGDGDYHPIDWGTALLNSSPDFAVLKFVWFGGAWQPQIDVTGGSSEWWATPSSVLAPNQWYRFEIAWHRVAESQWRVSYRIYDGDVLIVDEGDMLGLFGSQPNNPLSGVTFTNTNAARSTMLEIGSPGVGGLSSNPHEAERYAAIAAFVGAPVEDLAYVAERGW